MPADTKKLEKIVAREKDRIKLVQDGIIDGILEGAREGATQGLKKGAKDTFKDLITGEPGSISDIDFQKILEGIAEDTIKTTIKETAKNAFSKPAEIYVHSVCDRITGELEGRNIRLKDNEISELSTLIRKAHQDLIKNISDKLPDNPFINELFAGLQEALEDALDKELKLFEERLKDKG